MMRRAIYHFMGFVSIAAVFAGVVTTSFSQEGVGGGARVVSQDVTVSSPNNPRAVGFVENEQGLDWRSASDMKILHLTIRGDGREIKNSRLVSQTPWIANVPVQWRPPDDNPECTTTKLWRSTAFPAHAQFLGFFKGEYCDPEPGDAESEGEKPETEPESEPDEWAAGVLMADLDADANNDSPLFRRPPTLYGEEGNREEVASQAPPRPEGSIGGRMPGLVIGVNRGFHEGGREDGQEDYELPGIAMVDRSGGEEGREQIADPDLVASVATLRVPAQVRASASLTYDDKYILVYAVDNAGNYALIQSGTSYPYDPKGPSFSPASQTNPSGSFQSWGARTDLVVEGIAPSQAVGESYMKLTLTPRNGTPSHDRVHYTVVDPLMIPDFTRDRVIDDDDKEVLADGEPWRMWINDNNDALMRGETRRDDGFEYYNPGISERFEALHGDPDGGNASDDIVNGPNDLVDFFPLWLDLFHTLQACPPQDGFEYRLSQADNAVRYVYTGLSRQEAGRFHTHNERRYSNGFSEFAHRSFSHLVTAEGVALSEDFLERILDDEHQGVLMIEGAQATTEPLILEIWNGDARLFTRELPLSISPVEDFYRWLNLRGVAEGAEERATDVSEPDNFPDALSNGRQVVFIHGYNVNERASQKWVSEPFKRLYQSGSFAKFTGVSWHGNQHQLHNWTPFIGGTTVDFYTNVVNALETAKHFAQQVAALPGDKVVMAHSLGNMVVSSAIVDHGLTVDPYILLNAAVAIEAFNPEVSHRERMRHPRWQNYDDRLWASEWHKLFLDDQSDGRGSFTWREFFGIIEGAISYYSSTEDVLADGDGSVPSIGTEQAWVNQEMRKGLVSTRLTPRMRQISQSGWRFNTHYFTWQPRRVGRGPNQRRPMPPEETSEISDEQLRVEPFFRPFLNEDLLGPNGGEIAKDPDELWPVLAGGIPALTNPTGGPSGHQLPGGMATVELMEFQSEDGWPRRPRDGTRPWRHSDLKDIAYLFNFALYDNLVEVGGLR